MSGIPSLYVQTGQRCGKTPGAKGAGGGTWGVDTNPWTVFTRPHQATCFPSWERHPHLCVSFNPVPSLVVTTPLRSGRTAPS